MAQHDPLTRITVEATEDLEDAWTAITADGQVEPHEITFFSTHVRLVAVSAQRADLALSAGLATIRGGTESPRALRLVRELATIPDPEAA